MPEDREAMFERMKRVRAGKGKQASAVIQTVSEETEFMINAANRPSRPVNEPIEGENNGVTEGGIVTRLKGGLNDTVTMYKPTPNGYMPRRVTTGSISMNLANGFTIRCPQCNGHHGGDPNECAGRDPIAVRICPVCSKRIYDNRVQQAVDMRADDPNVIQDEAYAASTPAVRTKAALDWHIWNRHPQEAREMGLAALAKAPEEVVPDALKGHGLADIVGTGVAT